MSELFSACASNDVDRVRRVFSSNDVDVNLLNEKGLTVLHVAVSKDFQDIVRELARFPKLDINKQDKKGRTAINIAAANGLTHIVIDLLRHPSIDIDQPSFDGWTPLLKALANNHDGVVEHLQRHRTGVLEVNVESEIEEISKNLKTGSPLLLTAIGKFLTALYIKESQQLVFRSNIIKQFNLLFSSAVEKNALDLILWSLQGIVQVDSVRKVLIKSGTFLKISNYFVSFTNSLEISNIGALRGILSKSIDIRQQFYFGNSTILEILLPFFSNDSDLSVQAAAFVLTLIDVIPKDDNILNKAKDIIFNSIQSNNLAKRDEAFDCLMEIATIEDSRNRLIEIGVKDLLTPFYESDDDSDTQVNFAASVIQALLAANDTSSTTESGAMETFPKVVERVVDSLKVFTNSKIVFVDTLDGYTASLKTILIAIRSLAINEENYQQLRSHNIENALIDLFVNRKDDYFFSNFNTFLELVFAIWTLTFNNESCEVFISKGLIELVKSIPKNNEKSLQRGIEGILWNLEKKATTRQNNIVEDKKNGQIMISYSWKQQARMRQLAFYLRDGLGIPVWIDIEEMRGSVLERMAEAVEESSVIIIGFSSSYKESQACRTEAEYAYKLKKKVIYVAAEDGYAARGWLGAMMGNHLWYSPWKHQNGFEMGVTDVVKTIKVYDNEINTVTTSVPLTKTSQTNSGSGSGGGSGGGSSGNTDHDFKDLLTQLIERVDSLSNEVRSLSKSVDSKIESISGRVDLVSSKVDLLSSKATSEKSFEERIGSLETSLKAK